MKKRYLCPSCSVTLQRSRRCGVLERYVLAQVPFVRPFRCPECRQRVLRLTHRPSPQGLLLFLLTVLFGIILVQTIWWVGVRARAYSDDDYQPKDVERQIHLEKQ